MYNNERKFNQEAEGARERGLNYIYSHYRFNTIFYWLYIVEGFRSGKMVTKTLEQNKFKFREPFKIPHTLAR